MGTAVGIIGLGIMGSAISKNLLREGLRVVGHDVLQDRNDALADAGGEPASSARQVVEKAAIIITSLPSASALHDVVGGANGLLSGGGDEVIVIETSTLPIEEKRKAHSTLEAAGITLLDCPISGTGAQAVTKDLMILGSGDRQAFDVCVPVFEAFARAHTYLGTFGNGSKMKFVANLLINVHNVAAAEAMVLGMKAGLDPETIYAVISDSAATSRMFELRGPMMVQGAYDEPTMKIETWQKDLQIIGSFAAALACPTPLFAAASQPYLAAMSQGRGKQDTAAVCAILEDMAGIKRNK